MTDRNELGSSAIVGMGIQNKHSSEGSYAATTSFDRLTLTEWEADPDITLDDMEDEFTGDTAVFPTEIGVRLGVSSPFSGQGRIRAERLIKLLLAAGGANTPAIGSGSPIPVGVTNNVIIPVTTDALFPWSAWYAALGTSTNKLARLIQDCRLSRLRIVANRNSIARCEFTGMGTHEQIAAGTETLVADAGNLIRVIGGSFSFVDNAQSPAALAASARSVDLEILNEFPPKDDNFVVGGAEMSWMEWRRMLVTGNCDVAFTKALWAKLNYGGASSAGSGYSFTQLEGALDFTLESAGMIVGSTPYSVRVEIPHLVANGGAGRISGRNEVRAPVAWRARKVGNDPLWRITVATASA